MEIVKLQARERSGLGKSYTRKARAQGWVPAVYYGSDRDPKKIEVSHREFATIVRAKRQTHIIDLGLGGGDDSFAVIREVQRHSLKDSVYYHLDFMHVDMNKKIVVDVVLELTGVPVGVKDDNGVLGHPLKSLKVECLPGDMPEKITVDVTALKIGESIHARDVSYPNFTLKHAPDEVLAVVTHPTREKEAKPAEGEEAAAAPAGKAAAPAGKPAAGKVAAPAGKAAAGKK